MPIRLLNALGPLVRALGLWPRVDTEKLKRIVEAKWKRDNWPAPLLKALPPRAKAFNDDIKPSLFGALVIRSQFERSCLDHRTDIFEHAEGKGVLLIDRCACQ